MHAGIYTIVQMLQLSGNFVMLLR